MPDRYTADEARRIFARASRRQHVAPAEDGLSLDDLQKIGREAGLDPEWVAAEARAERLDNRPQSTWHGVPVGLRRSRVLPHRLSDTEWERVVDLLRDEFDVAGVSEQIGRRREWATVASTGGSLSSAYRLRVEERPEGDLVTISAPNVTRAVGRSMGGTMAGIAVVLGAMIGTLKPEKLGEALAFFSVFLALGIVLYGATWVSARQSVGRTSARLDALLDRIDLLSREDASAPATAERVVDTGPSGRLSLDETAVDPDSTGVVSSRHRTRA